MPIIEMFVFLSTLLNKYIQNKEKNQPKLHKSMSIFKQNLISPWCSSKTGYVQQKY